jgi:hypothetical protein
MNFQYNPDQTIEECEERASKYISFYEKEYGLLNSLNDLLQVLEYIQAKVDNILSSYPEELGYQDIAFN